MVRSLLSACGNGIKRGFSPGAAAAGSPVLGQLSPCKFTSGYLDRGWKKNTKISLICGDALHNQTKASLFLLQTLR